MVERRCIICGRLFLARRNHVRDGGGKYCTKRCYWVTYRNQKKPPSDLMWRLHKIKEEGFI